MADNYVETMGKIKKGVKILFIVSMLLSLASIVLLVVFNFAGVIHIQTIEGNKYASGFDYPGWQILYWGVGDMIIQGYTEYTFNIWNTLAVFVPLFACLVTGIMYLKSYKVRGTNKKKAILEIIAGVALLFGAIMIINCDKFAIANASRVKDSYVDYYSKYLLPALNGETSYGKTIYPLIVMIVGLVGAVVKFANAALLLFQKSYAKKAKANQ